MQTISIIGAPTHVGTHIQGADMGPDVLRSAGLIDALRNHARQVIDQGNLSGPPNIFSEIQPGLKNLSEVSQWNRLVFNSVAKSLALDQLPILLGGDHCLAIGSISAVAQHCKTHNKKCLVLWFDAHTDANTQETSPSGNLHGMPVSCLLGYGPASLTQLHNEHHDLPSHESALQVDQLRLIGIRSIDPEEAVFVKKLGITLFDMQHIKQFGLLSTLQKILADVDKNTHIHISFDLDCLDPSFAPGVSTAVSDGLHHHDVKKSLAMIAATGCLGSVDLVDFNPKQDHLNATAKVAIDLVKCMLALE